MPPATDLIEAAAQTIKPDNFQRILILGSAPNSLQAVNWPRELFDKIVADYRIKDRSKAFRVLLDYVVDNEKAWDEMFKRKRCKRCY